MAKRRPRYRLISGPKLQALIVKYDISVADLSAASGIQEARFKSLVFIEACYSMFRTKYDKIIDFLKSKGVTAEELDISADVDVPHPPPPPPPPSPPPRPDKRSVPGPVPAKLFGREDELAWLNQAWEDPEVNVICFSAQGGMGKTGLINWWLQDDKQPLSREGRVYVRGLYVHGITDPDQPASSDSFIRSALSEFGDQNPDQGDSHARGTRLAKLIQERPTLLVLDGLESFQVPSGSETGMLRDEALRALLCSLAEYNPGLCVLTSRLTPGDLRNRKGVKLIELKHLSRQAGAALLGSLGVRGDPGELKNAAGEYGDRPLALIVLAGILRERFGGDILRRGEIESLEEPVGEDDPFDRVMSSYVKIHHGAKELALLRLLGLFIRPADRKALTKLLRNPPIPDLTEALQMLSDDALRGLAARLRQDDLVDPEGRDDPDTLNVHPLVRRYFRERLRHEHPAAWREGNLRLFNHYNKLSAATPAGSPPEGIEALSIPIAAVTHGCRAEHYKDAYLVYWEHISRKKEYYITRVLSEYNQDLVILKNFFKREYNVPRDGFPAEHRVGLLRKAGLDLFSVGRLWEAADALLAGRVAAEKGHDWRNAAILASDLGRVLVTHCGFQEAEGEVRLGLRRAIESGDEVQVWRRRATLGYVLHQRGKWDEAEGEFAEAERQRLEGRGGSPVHGYLDSVHGFRYGALRLERGGPSDVLDRGEWMLADSRRGQNPLFDDALARLLLGRAHMFLSQQGRTGRATHRARAEKFLDEALPRFRRLGIQHYVVEALLDRARFLLEEKEYDIARTHLDEALAIADRHHMCHLAADVHLAYVRLHLASGQIRQDREHLAKARDLIKKGYGRREKELAELEELVGPLS